MNVPKPMLINDAKKEDQTQPLTQHETLARSTDRPAVTTCFLFTAPSSVPIKNHPIIPVLGTRRGGSPGVFTYNNGCWTTARNGKRLDPGVYSVVRDIGISHLKPGARRTCVFALLVARAREKCRRRSAG